MKIGVITDEVTQDFNEIVQFAKKHCLNGVELRTIEDFSIDSIPVQKAKEINEGFSEEGLEVCNISSSLFKCSLFSQKDISENMEKLKRLAERADIFNCHTIRGFSFFQEGSFEENLNFIAEKLYPAIELLQKQNIKLLLEADPSVFTTNCRKLSRLIDMLNTDAVGAIYDPGNDIYDPDTEEAYPEGFEEIKNYICHVHIKDAVIKDGKARSVKVGSGSVPYELIFKALEKINYRGYAVLETHYRPQTEIPDELLKLPGGRKFSFNGNIASQESMIELKKLMADYIYLTE